MMLNMSLAIGSTLQFSIMRKVGLREGSMDHEVVLVDRVAVVGFLNEYVGGEIRIEVRLVWDKVEVLLAEGMDQMGPQGMEVNVHHLEALVVIVNVIENVIETATAIAIENEIKVDDGSLNLII